MSTLEAIASAVRLLEGEVPAAELEALHAVFVQSVLETRGIPRHGADDLTFQPRGV